MIWWIIAAVLFALLALGGCLVIIVGVVSLDIEGEGLLSLGATLIGVLMLLGGVVGAVKSGIAAARTINETACVSFAEQTEYTTKLIITNWTDSGTCYVRFNDNWVPRSQLWAEMRAEL
jgi:hypothetical protein